MKLHSRNLFLTLVGTNCLLGAILFAFSGDQNPLESTLLLGSFLILSTTYCFIVTSKTVRPLSFTLLLFWCYGMVMPGLYQTRLHSFFWRPEFVDSKLILPAALLCLFSTIAYPLGYFSGKMNSFPKIEARWTRNDRTYNKSTAFILLLAILYSGYAVSKLGITPFISNRAASSIAMSQAGLDTAEVGLLKTLPSGLSITAFLIAAFQTQIQTNRTAIAKILFGTSFILMLAMNFPLSQPRFMMISTAIIIGLTIARQFHFKHKTIIYISAPILMYLIFPFLGQFNRYEDSTVDFFTNPIKESMLHGDFDGFQSLINSIGLVESTGIAWGGRILSAIFFMIPRSILLSKHNPTGSDAAEFAGYDFLNISMPLPGELYADFGWLGVVFGMFFFGRIIKSLDFRIANASFGKFGSELIMLGIVLTAYMPILFRGSLLAVISAPMVSIALIFVWSFSRRIRV